MSKLKETVITDFTDPAEIVNFRVLADGTLKKRDGFTVIASFDKTVRGVCTLANGVIYAVAGGGLYKAEDGEATLVGELDGAEFESEDARCVMYSHAGIVYMIGGGVFLCYDTGADTPVIKPYEYVPVCKTESEEYSVKGFNLICDRVREVTILSDINRSYTLKYRALSVAAVTLDGVLLDSSQYNHSEFAGDDIVTIRDTSLLSSDNVMVVDYVLDPREFVHKRDAIGSCKQSYVCEGEYGTRVLFYGGSEGCLYYSVSTDDAASGALIGDYFPVGSELYASGEGERILCVTHFGERTFVMTDSGAYYLAERTKTVDGVATFNGLRLVSIDKELGIGETSGAVVYDGTAYFANAFGLYALTYNPIEYKYTSSLIEIPDSVGIQQSALSGVRLHIDRLNHELWCIIESGIAVYDLTLKKWYRFTGFSPRDIFTFDGCTAFFDDGRICVFRMGEALDGEVGFDAYVETKNLDLDGIFSEKTVYGFGAAIARCEGAALECTLTSDKGDTFSFSVESDASDAGTTHVVKRTHARLGGCYYVICRVTSPANAAPAQLKAIMIAYRTMGGGE